MSDFFPGGRRQFLHALAGVAAATTLPAFAQKPDFPARPIRLISGFPPGGQGDSMARLFADKIKQASGWDMIVENKPGGALVLATEYVAKSEPDGQTIGLFPQAAYAANQVLFKRLPFDPNKDVTPISIIGRASVALVAHPSLGVDNLKDLIALTRKGEVAYGTTGAGTIGHVVLETINKETGARFKLVPYKGEAQGAQDLMGGHIKLMILTAAGLRIVMATNTGFKPIAVTGKRRWAGYDNMPTIEEVLGTNPVYTLAGWQGFVGPAGMPAPVVQALAGRIAQAYAQPETQQRLNAVAVLPELHGPAEFARIYRAETATWVKALTDLGLQGSAG
jgi:tripartite-type tricarboxylate transporter receptor subunit TctC